MSLRAFRYLVTLLAPIGLGFSSPSPSTAQSGSRALELVCRHNQTWNAHNVPVQSSRRSLTQEVEMIYTLFFSKMRDLSPAEMEEYQQRSAALGTMVEAEHPGFVSMKTYVADDGDRLTVVRFRDAESQRAWKLVPEHREAQARGGTQY